MATKRQRLIIVAIFVALVVFGVVLTRKEKDPIYKGHRMSEWLGCLIQYPDMEKEFNPPESEVREAIVATGTNNIPLLINWIAADTDTTLLDRMFRIMPIWVNRLHIFDRQFKAEMYKSETAGGAARSFEFLGDKGVIAIPQLTKIARTGNELARQRALEALCLIGDPAVPSILSIAATPDERQSPVRFMAIGDLSRHTNDLAVHTFLSKATNDPDTHVASVAADALRGTNDYN